MGQVFCYPGNYYNDYKSIKELKESTQDITESQKEIECLRENYRNEIEVMSRAKKETEKKMLERATIGDRSMVEVYYREIKTKDKQIRFLNKSLGVMDSMQFKLFQVDSTKKLVQVMKNTSSTVNKTLKEDDVTAVDSAADSSFDADEKLRDLGNAWNEFVSNQDSRFQEDPEDDDFDNIDKIMQDATGSDPDGTTSDSTGHVEPITSASGSKDGNADQSNLIASSSSSSSSTTDTKRLVTESEDAIPS